MRFEHKTNSNITVSVELDDAANTDEVVRAFHSFMLANQANKDVLLKSFQKVIDRNTAQDVPVINDHLSDLYKRVKDANRDIFPGNGFTTGTWCYNCSTFTNNSRNSTTNICGVCGNHKPSLGDITC